MVVSSVDSVPGLKAAGIGSSNQIQQLDICHHDSYFPFSYGCFIVSR